MDSIKIPSIKVVFVGESSVGKSSVIGRYFQKENFHIEDQKATLSKEFECETKVKGSRKLNIQYNDTPGQTNYRNITSSYIRKSHIALLVFDVKSEESLRELTAWNDILEKHNDPTLVKIMVGNKVDLIAGNAEKEEVETQAKAKAQEINAVNVFFTSALTAEGVEKLFEVIINESFKLNVGGQSNGTSLQTALKDSNRPCSKSKCC